MIRLSDPAQRNALSVAMSDQLALAVGRSIDQDVGAIMLTSTPPVFCAGGSLDDLLFSGVPLADRFRGLLALADSPVPTVAAVSGPVIGAGTNLALACDVVLTSPDARFDPRFIDLGLHPGGGLLWRLQQVVGPQATAAMVLFGETLDGHEAVTAGLAWRCVAADALEGTALEMCRRVVGRPGPIVRRTVETMRMCKTVTDPTTAFNLELEAQEWSMGQPFFADMVRAKKRSIADDG